MAEETDDTSFEQWAGAANAIDDRMDQAILAAGHKKVRVIYSAYHSGADDIPIDNLDEVAIHGRCRCILPRNTFFGGDRSKEYQTPVLTNPTWMELCIHVNEAIRVVRDRHHVYFEGVDLLRKDGDVAVYEFCMGS